MSDLPFQKFILPIEDIKLSANIRVSKQWSNITGEISAELIQPLSSNIVPYWRFSFSQKVLAKGKKEGVLSQKNFPSLQTGVDWFKQYAQQYLSKKQFHKIDFRMQRKSFASHRVVGNPTYDFASFKLGQIHGYSGFWNLINPHKELQDLPITYQYYKTRKKIIEELYSYIGENLFDLFIKYNYLVESEAEKVNSKILVSSYAEWTEYCDNLWWCIFLKPGIDLNQHFL